MFTPNPSSVRLSGSPWVPLGNSGKCNGNDTQVGLGLCREKCRDGFREEAGVCWESCGAGTHVDTGKICREKCRAGHKDVVGVCYSECDSNQTDVGALCRDKCRDGYKDVAGVCWETCGDKRVEVGAMCRDKCRDGFKDVAGVCWKGCKPGDKQVGALCRERCPKGYKEVAGVCWKGFKSKVPKTYAKQSYIPSTGAKKSYVPATKAKTSYVPSNLLKKNYVPKTYTVASAAAAAAKNKQTPPSSCPLECQVGWKNIGGKCYENCPKDWTDHGLLCRGKNSKGKMATRGKKSMARKCLNPPAVPNPVPDPVPVPDPMPAEDGMGAQIMSSSGAAPSANPEQTAVFVLMGVGVLAAAMFWIWRRPSGSGSTNGLPVQTMPTL